MKIKDDKLFFDAMYQVSKDRSKGSVGLHFHHCNNAFLKLLYSLPREQQDIIIDYVHAHQALHMAAFDIVLERRKFRLFQKRATKESFYPGR